MNDVTNFSKIDTIELLEARGPWQSKSGGKLSVLFAMDKSQIDLFTNFTNNEFNNILNKTNVDIRGIRAYRVTGIPKGSVGANEFHMARTEIVSMISGSALWRCEDIFGNVAEYTIDESKSLLIPYGILHTYTALEDNSGVQVLCNTLFEPEIAGTHDSYLLEDFKQAQKDLTTKN